MTGSPDRDLAFTDDDWHKLFELPPLIGAAMMLAGHSGLGSIKEAMAVARNVIAGGREHPHHPIIQHLDEMRRAGHKSEIEKLGGSFRGLSPDEIRAVALDRCRQVRFLVRQHATSDLADEYLQWCFRLGQKVAEAAKEGGFLGIGGERVSEPEREFLVELAEALGLDTVA